MPRFSLEWNFSVYYIDNYSELLENLLDKIEKCSF